MRLYSTCCMRPISAQTILSLIHIFALIRASFNQRRKTLVNSLKNASDLKLEKEQVLEALRTMGLSETVRGEALTLEQFASLADLLKA